MGVVQDWLEWRHYKGVDDAFDVFAFNIRVDALIEEVHKLRQGDQERVPGFKELALKIDGLNDTVNVMISVINKMPSLDELPVLKIKLCPLCGGNPSEASTGTHGIVRCTKCGLRVKKSTLEDALSAWNRRL